MSERGSDWPEDDAIMTLGSERSYESDDEGKQVPVRLPIVTPRRLIEGQSRSLVDKENVDESGIQSKAKANQDDSEGIGQVVPLVVGAVWAIAVAVGGILVSMFSKLTGEGSVKTSKGQNYYSIVKPPVAPAPIAFVIVWTLLFVLYGIGGVALVWPCLVCGKRDKDLQTKIWSAAILYMVVLGLLYAWMPVFANQKNPKSAAYLLVSMLVLYVPLLSLSASVSWLSAACLAPLFGWLIFAMIMNNDSVARWTQHNTNEQRETLRQDMMMAAQQEQQMRARVEEQMQREKQARMAQEQEMMRQQREKESMRSRENMRGNEQGIYETRSFIEQGLPTIESSNPSVSGSSVQTLEHGQEIDIGDDSMTVADRLRREKRREQMARNARVKQESQSIASGASMFSAMTNQMSVDPQELMDGSKLESVGQSNIFIHPSAQQASMHPSSTHPSSMQQSSTHPSSMQQSSMHPSSMQSSSMQSSMQSSRVHQQHPVLPLEPMPHGSTIAL